MERLKGDVGATLPLVAIFLVGLGSVLLLIEGDDGVRCAVHGVDADLEQICLKWEDKNGVSRVRVE